MANILPSVGFARRNGGLFRELGVLERLQASLPNGFEVFHNVTWHSVHDDRNFHGEIDIVVLGPQGNMLLLEVKAGDVILEDGKFFKLYDHKRHDVTRQTSMQYGAMRGRLKDAKLQADVEYSLVLPDYKVGDVPVVSLTRKRVFDSTQFEDLGRCVHDVMRHGRSSSGFDAIHRFLANEFQVSPDVHVLGEQLQRTTRQLADGLATWVPRIQAPSGVIRVQATAGSGKTQLALRLLAEASQSQLRALYVCYNRNLADHMGRLAPARAKVVSFHELCVAHWRQTQQEPDFTQADCFARLTQAYCEAAAAFPANYDLIILDEGQDLEPDWVASLLEQLKPQGRLYLLEDEAQRLYARDGFDLSDAVTLSCHDNFRSPSAVCDVINALGLAGYSIQARNPYKGDCPGFHVYDSDEEMLRQTARAVQRLLDRGISLGGIVVLSGKGLQKSILLHTERLRSWGLRRFTGQYSADGDACWSEGELLAESIYRFKGQSAQGIVLSEFDFDQLDVATQRKLFVGFTRAHIAVEVVLSRDAERCLTRELAA